MPEAKPGDPSTDLRRVDAELVRRGLARSRAAAQLAIDEGRVFLAGRPVRKPSEKVREDSPLELTESDHYVARSAWKLIAALDAFGIDPAGRLALDVGASTGGFTQVLLERGAREVIALDVGHDQLVAELRADSRVRVIEGSNARELTREILAEQSGTDDQPDLVVVDVSFISLRTVLPALVDTASSDSEFVVLIKPQFEVGRSRVREGLVVSREDRHAAIRDVLEVAEGLGMSVGGVIASPITGTNGNQEYLAALETADRGARAQRAAGAQGSWHDSLAELP